MKKVFFVLLSIVIVELAQAQTELKVNPIGILFGRPDVSAEFFSSESFGVELSTGIAIGKAPGITSTDSNPTQSGFGIKLAGKYYLSPEETGDGLYMGLYLRHESLKIEDKDNDFYSGFKRSIVAAGLEFGKKWVTDSGLILEAGMGFGKALSEKNEWLEENSSEDFGIKLGVDFTGKFAIGYRFGESTGSSKKKSNNRKRRRRR